MKLKKYITALAASVAGAGVIATAPAYADGHTGYSQSFSGNVRVEAVTRGVRLDPLFLTTGFGGDEEESSTGGDTHLTWTHRFVGENGEASGFLRFASDGDLRVNVQGFSELGNYRGDIKAEWELAIGGERDPDGGISVTERDQFARLEHTGIGLYYKIGSEEWLGNQKGYTSDFLSYTKSYADLDFGGNRFAAHQLGWNGAGLDIALLLQRDNTGSSRGRPYGVSLGSIGISGVPQGTVESYGLQLAYSGGPVDFATMFGWSQATPWRVGVGTTSYVPASSQVFVTELQLALTFGRFQPFFNFGYQGATDRLDDRDDSGVLAATIPVNYNRGPSSSDYPAGSGREIPGLNQPPAVTYNNGDLRFIDQWGVNGGIAINLGASDIVIAGGGQQRSFTGLPEAQTRGGIDLIWATNQDPLRVSLAAAYSAGTQGNPDALNVPGGRQGNNFQDYRFGGRLDFSF